MPKIPQAKALKITFLSPFSLGSLNGSDKEANNLSSIKKPTRGPRPFLTYPARPSRRALRDQLEVLGHPCPKARKGRKRREPHHPMQAVRLYRR